jgi:hypothetical protein
VLELGLKEVTGAVGHAMQVNLVVNSSVGSWQSAQAQTLHLSVDRQGTRQY